jgi:hypothetical protein
MNEREEQPDRARQIAAFRELIAAGRLRRGMTCAEVKEALGEPDAVGCSSRRYPAPSCFVYGHLQLFFGPRARDGLTMVFSEDESGQDTVTLPLPG